MANVKSFLYNNYDTINVQIWKINVENEKKGEWVQRLNELFISSKMCLRYTPYSNHLPNWYKPIIFSSMKLQTAKINLKLSSIINIVTIIIHIIT